METLLFGVLWLFAGLGSVTRPLPLGEVLEVSVMFGFHKIVGELRVHREAASSPSIFAR